MTGSLVVILFIVLFFAGALYLIVREFSQLLNDIIERGAVERQTLLNRIQHPGALVDPDTLRDEPHYAYGEPIGADDDPEFENDADELAMVGTVRPGEAEN